MVPSKDFIPFLTNRFTGQKIFKESKKINWKAGSVYKILTNKVYRGEMRYKSQIIPVPALITEEKWNQIQLNLKRNKNNSRNHQKKHFYLLKSLLACGRCDRNLHGSIVSSRKQRVYRCSSKLSNPKPNSCGLKNISIDKLNDLVAMIIHEVSIGNFPQLKKLFEDDKRVDKKDIKKHIESLNRELTDKDAEKSKLVRLYGKSQLTEKELDQHLLDLSLEKEKIDREIRILENKLSIR